MTWGLPENAGTFTEVDSLYQVVLVLTGVAFVLTEGLLVYCLLRFRAKPGGRSAYVHGHHRLEIAWSLIPGLILFGLAVYQYAPWITLKEKFPPPESAVQIQLAPEQFLWKVTYPGGDGLFDTPDDIQSGNNEIHVPVDEPVLVTLKAADVIHSFFVPVMRVKQDALPGTVTRAWFRPTKVGVYEVACAELCGLGHYKMRALLTVETRGDFDAWLATKAAQASRGPDVAPIAYAPASR